MIEEITQSFHYLQMHIYANNYRYEKALAMVEQLIQDYEKNGEPNTMLFLYKQKYKIQVNIERLAGRDAEMTLHNSIALIDTHLDEF